MSDQTTPLPQSSPPPVPSPLAPRSAPVAIWSLVLGIFSFVCGGFITAIPAIICGHVGRSTIRRSGGALSGMGLATAGLILGYVALALNIILIPMLLIPAIAKAHHEMRESGHRSSSDTKEMVSADGKSRLVVPHDWKELEDLNDAAELQAGNKSKEQYLIILSEDKADLANFTLQKHHQTTRDAMLQKMGNASASQPVEVTIDGQSALQDEITGTQDGTNIVFLHTTIESDDGYHQILAWTTRSRWDKNKEKLQEVTRSFRSEK
jgi:hypothetical protein